MAQEIKTENPFEIIPYDVLCYIFYFVDLPTLFNVPRVNKYLSHVSENTGTNSFWKIKYEQYHSIPSFQKKIETSNDWHKECLNFLINLYQYHVKGFVSKIVMTEDSIMIESDSPSNQKILLNVPREISNTDKALCKNYVELVFCIAHNNIEKLQSLLKQNPALSLKNLRQKRNVLIKLIYDIKNNQDMLNEIYTFVDKNIGDELLKIPGLNDHPNPYFVWTPQEEEAEKEGEVLFEFALMCHKSREVLTKLQNDFKIKIRNSFLEMAIEYNSLEGVKFFIEDIGVNVNHITYIFSEESNLIFKAAEMGRTQIVEYLITKGADYNIRFESTISEMQSPLSIAVYKGHLEVVQCLLKYVANIDYKIYKEKWTLLDLAIFSKEEAIAKCLAQEFRKRSIYADPFNVFFKAVYGKTKDIKNLIYFLPATQTINLNNDIEIIKYFLNTHKEFDLNRKDVYKKSILNNAIQGGNTKIVNLLIENGANINEPDSSDFTPLTMALEFAIGTPIGHASREIVDMILKAGAILGENEKQSIKELNEELPEINEQSAAIANQNANPFAIKKR